MFHPDSVPGALHTPATTRPPRQKMAISSGSRPREQHRAGKTNRPFLLWPPAGDGWPEGLAVLMDNRSSCVGQGWGWPGSDTNY